MALFTVHTTVTSWDLVLGGAIGLFLIMVGGAIVKNALDDVRDKAYVEGYDSGQADSLAGEIDTIEEYANNPD